MSTEYPQRPKTPELLRKVVSQLSDAELLTVPGLKKAYSEAMEKYRSDMAAYNADQAQKVQDLRDRCEAEFQMKDHPKANALWDKAWDEGHSSGLQEVYNAYADLVELAR